MRFTPDQRGATEFEKHLDALFDWFQAQDLTESEAVNLLGCAVTGILREQEDRDEFIRTLLKAWKIREEATRQ